MFRRFAWIRDAGHFGAFWWPKGLPEFERINVIYGPNGSGKTSLARMVDGLRSEPEGFRRVSAVIEDAEGCRDSRGSADPAFDRLLVFSEAYVQRSHRFDEASPDMDAILTLGVRTVEDEKRLQALREERDQLLEEQSRLTKEKAGIDKELKAAYERAASAVVGDLASVGGPYASRGSYSIAKVKARMEDLSGGLASLPPDELARNRQQIVGGNREALPFGDFGIVVDPAIVGTAAELLSTTPVTIVLDTLQAHPEASSWVQQGIALHVRSELCAFCGGSITADRRAVIERHFSDEVDRLQAELEGLSRRLVGLSVEADRVAHRIPDGGLVFKDLREPLETQAQCFREEVAAFRDWCAVLVDRLEQKRADVLADVDHGVEAPPAIDGSALKRITDQHNSRVADYAQLVDKAAAAIERHHLQAEEAPVQDLTMRCVGVSDRLANIAARLKGVEPEIVALETADGDPTPSAEVLTNEVSRLLGRGELVFAAVGSKYKVLRHGAPATGLSTGERTAITLVHFLETVARADPADGGPIVVIDDPVSSLDSNVFMGVSGAIWSAVVSDSKDHVAQLFLLTHDFELFRQWDIQLCSLPRSIAKRFPHQLYELRSGHLSVEGAPRRVPVLETWPPVPELRTKMRSTYHHGFLYIAQTYLALLADDSVERRLDAQLLLPNVIRRVLETFLVFKHPEGAGKFSSLMREAIESLGEAGCLGDAVARRQQLTRFADAYSHSENPDTGHVVSPDEIAATLGSVFLLMKCLDEGHFLGMCAAVGVEPGELVPPLGDGGLVMDVQTDSDTASQDTVDRLG